MNFNGLTVSQINRYIKFLITGDTKLRGVFVVGEVADFRENFRSGHWYFSLKDSDSVIRAVMFASSTQAVRFEVQNGMRVLVRADVTVYERDGSYQLTVRDMMPYGAGEEVLALEKRKAKLAAAGLFDAAHKKPIPLYPRKIAVITSKTGAALQDILHIFKRRMPQVVVQLYAVTMQGERSPLEVMAALRDISMRNEADEVIIARGGGSQEDLKWFNDERLAYAVYACPIPIISAVGHEIDYTICDLVADLRAPTPSAAAELAGAVAEDTAKRIGDIMNSLSGAVRRRLQREQMRLDSCKGRYMRAIEQKQRLLDLRFLSACQRAEAVNPFAVLNRGYAVVQKTDGRTVASIEQITPGDALCVHLKDGVFAAQVTEREEFDVRK